MKIGMDFGGHCWPWAFLSASVGRCAQLKTGRVALEGSGG